MNPGFSSKILQQILTPAPSHTCVHVRTPPPPQFNYLLHDPLENEKREKRKKHKKRLDREELTSSMMHSQKLNNLMLLMAVSLSAAHSSI
jgi:hypothetical protein